MTYMFDVTAPEFPVDLPWINSARPISMADLRGQVVLLNFWTYGRTLCTQTLTDLKFLEKKYGRDPFWVISVHCGKFDNEKSADHVRAAVRQQGMTHPVVVDSNYRIWQSYGVRSWPTWVLMGADGRVVGALSGDGHLNTLDERIYEALTQAKRLKISTRKIERPAKEPDTEKWARKALFCPSKVIAFGGDQPLSRRLFIADSGHHRILETTFDGKILRQFGSGQAGRGDGPTELASFNQPQGLAVWNDTLFVADTANHLVRAIDLRSQSVKTIVGTGVAGQPQSQSPGYRQALFSPTDLLVLNHQLYIANAGTHQLLALDLETQEVRIVLGSGQEDKRDGFAQEATLAQPSGLTTDGHYIYVTDSESSSVRRFDPHNSEVQTLIGRGLYEFGDIDGGFEYARLQHPQGIAFSNGFLLIADTFNHKIKRLNLKDKLVETLLGDGQSGSELSARRTRFFEPTGLSHAAGKWFVADSQNHRIVVYDDMLSAAAELNLRT